MKLFFSLCFFVSLNLHAQVAIVNTQEDEEVFNQVKKIITEKFYIPKNLIEEFNQDKCEASQKFDLVICVKKNGKLTFPVYKKSILKNSYRVFLEN